MIVILTELIFILLFPFVNKKYIREYFFILCLVLSVIAFNFQPPDNFDLYRHYETLDHFRLNGWNAVKNIYFYSSAPVYAFYFYIISLLPSNGFLPAINVFITYSLVLSIIYKVGRKYDCTKKSMMITFVFTLLGLDYLSAISGIRNILAFSIFAYFLYYDLVENKHKILSFIVYIAMCMLHNSCVILLMFRIVLFFYNKYTKRLFQGAFFLWGIFMPLIVRVLESIPNYYTHMFAEKIKTYYVGMMFNANLILFNLGLLIVAFAALYCYSKDHKKDYDYPANHADYMVLVILFTLGSVQQYDLFIRMVSFVVLASPYYLLRFFSVKEDVRAEEGVFITRGLRLLGNIGVFMVALLGILYQAVAYMPLVFSF